MELSVIIVTYERFVTLEKTVASIKELLAKTNIEYEIIVSDDCSKPETQERISKLPIDKCLFSQKNGGMGANTNKGINAAIGDYILQLQDDWVWVEDTKLLEQSLNYIKENNNVGIVNFITQKIMPYKNDQYGSLNIQYFSNNILSDSTASAYPYTDNPHLKSRKFIERVGLYSEDRDMRKVEIDYCIRVSEQNQYEVVDIGINCFKHIGEEFSYNPGYKMNKLKQDLLKNKFTKYPFSLALAVKKCFRVNAK